MKFKEKMSEEQFVSEMKNLYKIARVNTKHFLNNYADMSRFEIEHAARTTWITLSEEDAKETYAMITDKISHILLIEFLRDNGHEIKRSK